MSSNTQNPLSIVLTDISGTPLTPDDDHANFYNITTIGAATKYFYIDWNGNLKVRLTNIRLGVSAAVTLTMNLEAYVHGAWRAIPPYTPDSAFTTDEAQRLNTIYPLHEDIPEGTKLRLAATVSGVCDIFVNVTAR